MRLIQGILGVPDSKGWFFPLGEGDALVLTRLSLMASPGPPLPNLTDCDCQYFHYTASVNEDQVVIERILEPSIEHVEALARLLPQLSSAPPPTLDQLRSITENRATYLFFGRVNGQVVASCTLVTFATPTGARAWIEDVVVDSSSRGNGIATTLVKHALAEARQAGAAHVDLTSRPQRSEANRLYRRLGFSARETNVYRLQFED